MTSEIKYILSIFAIAIGFIWYYPYFRDIYKWKTKPHTFSWFIWWIITWIGFMIQVFEKWWFWSLVLWTVSMTCFTIAIIWIYQKQIKYHILDWFSLFWALTAIFLWLTIKNPLYSVLLISFIDFLAFIPTCRKIYLNPNSETLSTWYMMNIRMFLWIIALEIYSFNTVFYPLIIFTINAIAIIMIHWRKFVFKKIFTNWVEYINIE